MAYALTRTCRPPHRTQASHCPCNHLSKVSGGGWEAFRAGSSRSGSGAYSSLATSIGPTVPPSPKYVQRNTPCMYRIHLIPSPSHSISDVNQRSSSQALRVIGVQDRARVRTGTIGASAVVRAPALAPFGLCTCCRPAMRCCRRRYQSSRARSPRSGDGW